MKILICTYRSASDRIALSAVRDLARNGASVFLGGDKLSSPSFWSRHCHHRVRLPSPITDAKGFAEQVLKIVQRYNLDTVLPTDDYAVYALAKSVEEQDWPVQLPVPRLHDHMRAHDKFTALKIASDAGVRTPFSVLVGSSEAAMSSAAQFDGRFLVKPARGSGAVGVQIASDPQDLPEFFDDPEAIADAIFDFRRVIFQEFVPGETHDLCALFCRGEPRAALTSRRLLTFPPEGGGGILNETTDRNDVREQGIEILKQLNWHGPAQVEFKVDSRDGTATFIEVNGRLWGTLGLSSTAGIDFATMACRMAIDGDVDPRFDFPVGLRHRWPLPYALRYALEGRNRRSALSELLGHGIASQSDLDWSDPGPILAILMPNRWLPSNGASDFSPLPVYQANHQ